MVFWLKIGQSCHIRYNIPKKFTLMTESLKQRSTQIVIYQKTNWKVGYKHNAVLKQRSIQIVI